MTPEVVAAAAAATMPGGEVAGRFWGEIDPKAGTVALYPIHPGNVIYREERILSAVNYQYTTATQDPNCGDGTCTPAAGQVGLFTDQNTVTYVEDSQGINDGNPADDDCYNNGVFFDNDPTCGGKYQAGSACTKDHTFCGDIQITSNLTFSGAVGAMPDVVLDIGNPAGTVPPPVVGCLRNTSLGGAGGLCVDDGPAKISSSTSNFVPLISAGGGTLSCAYCYGNKSVATATSRPALQHAVISGSSAEKAAVNTNKVALKLNSSSGFTVTFIVYYATPAVNAPGSQISYSDANGFGKSCIGSTATRAVIKGGGFGPPADCIAAALPAACPVIGSPAAGYNLDFAHQLGAAPIEWSDTQLRSQTLTGAYGCSVKVNTPVGAITTDDNLLLCSGMFRLWTPAGYVNRTRVAGGVTNDFVVVMGGLSNPSTASGTTTIQAMPVPRCANPTPSFTTLATTLPAGAGLWAAASSSASDGIYYVGGADSGTTCSSRTFRFSYTGGATGTFTALPDLPVQLCHATAVTIFGNDGLEYVVVTGGLTRPVFRVPNSPAPSAADLAPQASYVWPVGGAGWITVAGAGIQRWNMGGAGYHDAAPANNNAIFVGGATVVSNQAPGTNTVNTLRMVGGAPVYDAAPDLPAARSAPAVVVVGTNFYVQGGADTIGPQVNARRDLYRLGALGGGWATVSTSGAQPRQGHLLVLSAFDETLPNNDLARLISISGNDGSTFRTSPDEFNP